MDNNNAKGGGYYGSNSNNIPSAPPMEQQPSAVPPQVYNFPRETVTQLQGGNPQTTADQSPPPPSYQDALHYPPAPPYPSYQPNTFPSMPPTTPQAPPSHMIYPPPADANRTATTNVYITPVAQPHIVAATVVRRNGCNHCLNGTVQSETDMCCLLCLILLAIVTFPFGLVLLFCLPCTSRKRCSACRRLYD